MSLSMSEHKQLPFVCDVNVHIVFHRPFRGKKRSHGVVALRLR